MNFDAISSVMGILFDELKDDKAFKAIIKKIDTASDDMQLKAGMKQGIARLRELGKHTLADDLDKKLKGW